MTTAQIIRLSFIALLWIALCALLIVRSGGITPYICFVIIVSGIVIFVPLYKKYIRKSKK